MSGIDQRVLHLVEFPAQDVDAGPCLALAVNFSHFRYQALTCWRYWRLLSLQRWQDHHGCEQVALSGGALPKLMQSRLLQAAPPATTLADPPLHSCMERCTAQRSQLHRSPARHRLLLKPSGSRRASGCTQEILTDQKYGPAGTRCSSGAGRSCRWLRRQQQCCRRHGQWLEAHYGSEFILN